MYVASVRVCGCLQSATVGKCVEGELLPTTERDMQRSFVSVSQRAPPVIIDAAVGPVPTRHIRYD